MSDFKHRVALALTAPAYTKLDELRTAMGAGSFSEVIRQAVAFIYWVKGRQQDGYQLALVKGDLLLPLGEEFPFAFSGTPTVAHPNGKKPDGAAVV